MNREIVIPPAQQVVIETTSGRQGPPGPAGPQGPAIDLPFSYGDASPAIVATVMGTVVAVSVVITTPFDGTGAAISVGTSGSPELLMPEAQNYPDSVARYEANPGQYVSGNVLVFITPGSGASTGAGMIYVEVTQ